jgi:hypothetical protein
VGFNVKIPLMCRVYFEQIHPLYYVPLVSSLPNSTSVFDGFHYAIFIHIYVWRTYFVLYHPVPSLFLLCPPLIPPDSPPFTLAFHYYYYYIYWFPPISRKYLVVIVKSISMLVLGVSYKSMVLNINSYPGLHKELPGE